jgi:hypothetical protein
MNVEITDDDVTSLKKLTNLAIFVLSACTFQTNRTAEEICYFVVNSKLVNVRLIDVPNTEMYLQAIIDKPTLQNIYIKNNAITDEIIGNINLSARQRKNITINSNSISNAGLMKIKMKPNMFLILENTTITETDWNNFLLANPMIEDYFYQKDKVSIRYKY